jgi:hypothetical protein
MLTESGFRVGGAAGYGLRRMSLSPEGSRRRLLGLGEIKDIRTGRVILVPGPAHEVKIVREIFRLRVSKRKSVDAIAAYLNQKGITHPGVPWGRGSRARNTGKSEICRTGNMAAHDRTTWYPICQSPTKQGDLKDWCLRRYCRSRDLR